MKRKLLLTFLFTTALITAITAAGCGNKHQHSYAWQSNATEHWQQCDCGDKKDTGAHTDENNDYKCDACGLEAYTVTFDMKGNGDSVAAQKIFKGGVASKPADPAADDYIFGGWFADSDCATPFEFTAAVNANVTAYAKWEADTRPVVTFDVLGHGVAPASQRVEAGGVATAPADPEEDGYIFDGWFADSDCAVEFDFTVAIEANTTVYAKWSVDNRPIVTFDTKGIGEAPASQRVEYGGFVTEPDLPVAEGYEFEGWFVDSACTQEFEFDLELAQSRTLYAKWSTTVSFNMMGHGTAVAAQKVTVGATVDTSAVGIPADEATFEFAGWYSDENCTAEFDFDAPVNAPVTVYAKWTAVLPKIEIGKQNTVPFGEGETVQFSFVAPKTGRFKLQGGNVNAGYCRFNTSLDDEGVYYGAGCDKKEVYFDLEYGKKIIATFYRAEGITDTSKVGFAVTEVVDEPFPAQGWVSGRYSDGTTEIEFERDAKRVTWNSATASVTYVGGSINTVSFKIVVAAGSTSAEYVCTLKQTEEDTFEFLYTANGTTYRATLARIIAQVQLDVSAFSGKYEPQEGGASIKDVNEIVIYESGNGYVNSLSNKYTMEMSSTQYKYDGITNILIYGNYRMTANLDDNNKVISLNVIDVSIPKDAVYCVYVRTEDAPDEIPDKLPLATGVVYSGATLGIISNYNQTWDDNTALKITAYDKANGVYTVTKGNVTYTLEIQGAYEAAVITVYDAKHENVIDTLAIKTASATPLVTDGTKVEFTSRDTYGNYKSMFYTVPSDGTYKFTASNKYIEVYVDVVNYNVTGMGAKAFTEASGEISLTVDLKAGSVIALSTVNAGSRVTNFWFTAKLQEEQGGGDEPGGEGNGSGTQADPYIAQVGVLKVENPVRGEKYYIKFTAPAAGTYKFCYSRVSSDGTVAYNNHYTVTQNGVEAGYGFNSVTFKWENGLSNDNPWATFEIAEGEEIIIVIECSRAVPELDFEIVAA